MLPTELPGPGEQGNDQRLAYTAIRWEIIENIDEKSGTVQLVSKNRALGLINAAELAVRLQVPESWIRNRTRARTPHSERIPCVRLGRYVRFEWRSRELQNWLEKRRE